MHVSKIFRRAPLFTFSFFFLLLSQIRSDYCRPGLGTTQEQNREREKKAAASLDMTAAGGQRVTFCCHMK